MLMTARVGPADTVLDLGCGDGRIVITAAQEFGARAVGVEIDGRLVRQARANAHAAGVDDRVAIWQEDLFAVDLRPATVLTMYLSHKLNDRLCPKLLRELRPGTRIVSHNIDMSNWKATSVEELNGHRIYFWIVPPRPWAPPPRQSGKASAARQR
jgi:cyclopropane fatty-acyl-phospholipid synthase-like methyltransferase